MSELECERERERRRKGTKWGLNKLQTTANGQIGANLTIGYNICVKIWMLLVTDWYNLVTAKIQQFHWYQRCTEWYPISVNPQVGISQNSAFSAGINVRGSTSYTGFESPCLGLFSKQTAGWMGKYWPCRTMLPGFSVLGFEQQSLVYFASQSVVIGTTIQFFIVLCTLKLYHASLSVNKNMSI